MIKLGIKSTKLDFLILKIKIFNVYLILRYV